MISAVHAFADEAATAGRLANAIGTPLETIELHVFPDAETLPKVAPATGTVVLHRSLWSPNDKIVPLLLAADALRRRGAERLVLVAPYLCYLRQDTVFHDGEPVSRDVLGRLLGERFDVIVTVQLHLHRTADLSSAFAGARTIVIGAGAAIAAALVPAAPGTVIVGPDIESAPWAAEVGACPGGSEPDADQAEDGRSRGQPDSGGDGAGARTADRADR